LLPALLGAALYVVNLPGTWIYDDLYFAKEDPRLHDVRHWRDFLTQEYMDGSADKLWRPLVSLSFAVEAVLHPEKAWPFHLVNLLLHAAVCALVAKLGERLTGRSGVGLVAGLLFAAHPIHVEAVTGIVGRSEEMCTLGVLASLLLVAGRALTIRRALAVTGWFLFAALSKEQGILLPFMLLGGWIISRGGARRVRDSMIPCATSSVPAGAVRSEAALAGKPPVLDYMGSVGQKASEAGQWLIALLTLTLAVYISYRNSVAKWYWDKGFLDWPMNPIVRSVGVSRWLMPVAIFGRYSALLVAPWRLAPDYSANVFTPEQRLGDPYLWIGVAALIGFISIFIVALRRGHTVLLFLLGCFAVTYFLAGNIVIIGTIFGERLMYLPSVFLCILAAMAIQKLPGSARGPLVVIVLIAFCVRTETYAWRWNDRLHFYEYAARVQPKSSQIFLLLGDELENRRNDVDGAERAYAQGRAACPESWRILNASARIALLRGHYDDAETWARQSMRIRPAPGTAELISEIVEKRSEESDKVTR
jgi:hypothetical protein